MLFRDVVKSISSDIACDTGASCRLDAVPGEKCKIFSTYQKTFVAMVSIG